VLLALGALAGVLLAPMIYAAEPGAANAVQSPTSPVFTPAHRSLADAIRDFFGMHPTPVQPIAYTHKVHLANGMDCTNCHTNVENGPVAGNATLASTSANRYRAIAENATCALPATANVPSTASSLTPDGESGLNYLCAGYKRFFRHVGPYMKFMANELRHQRSPANVMAWVRGQEQPAAPSTRF